MYVPCILFLACFLSLPRQRREEYYKRKAERERYTKAQANGMPYQPVNQGDGATAKLNMPANPSPKSTHIEMKPSKSTVSSKSKFLF